MEGDRMFEIKKSFASGYVHPKVGRSKVAELDEKAANDAPKITALKVVKDDFRDYQRRLAECRFDIMQKKEEKELAESLLKFIAVVEAHEKTWAKYGKLVSKASDESILDVKIGTETDPMYILSELNEMRKVQYADLNKEMKKDIDKFVDTYPEFSKELYRCHLSVAKYK